MAVDPRISVADVTCAAYPVGHRGLDNIQISEVRVRNQYSNCQQVSRVEAVFLSQKPDFSRFFLVFHPAE